jgi:hypothetical protein
MRWMLALVAAAAAVALVAPVRAQTATPIVEGQAVYMARCQGELVAEDPRIPRPQSVSICSSKWDQIVATGPMADALLAVAPATSGSFNAGAARAGMGPLRDFAVTVNRAPAGVTISWDRNGEPIPFDLEGALHARGATLAMVGCEWFGYSENIKVYRVSAPGKAPFGLTIAARDAAVASQSSSYGATTDFSGRLPTLATLNQRGQEFTAACPE